MDRCWARVVHTSGAEVKLKRMAEHWGQRREPGGFAICVPQMAASFGSVLLNIADLLRRLHPVRLGPGTRTGMVKRKESERMRI